MEPPAYPFSTMSRLSPRHNCVNSCIVRVRKRQTKKKGSRREKNEVSEFPKPPIWVCWPGLNRGCSRGHSLSGPCPDEYLYGGKKYDGSQLRSYTVWRSQKHGVAFYSPLRLHATLQPQVSKTEISVDANAISHLDCGVTSKKKF